VTQTESAIVLLSGGVDSTTALAVVQRECTVYALTISYGQRHHIEVDASRRIAERLSVRHFVAEIDLRRVGGSALTSDLVDVPRGGPGVGIPATYVPARNTIFLSLALSYAEVLGAGRIVIGANKLDSAGYPDCRPEYLEAFERMANLATKASVAGRKITIWAPLIHLGKADIIRRGLALGLDFSLTHTCYDPTPTSACGRCDACRFRVEAFADVGVPDPATYR
jgi:7-cyano-7-deazaguanine synthase